MRQAIAWAMQSWFAWTLPRGLSTETMASRERLRKARILSIGVFFAVVLGVPLILADLMTHVLVMVWVLVAYEIAHFSAGWLNRRGKIELASWVYIIGYLVTAAWGMAVQSPTAGVVPLWGWAQLLIPSVFAGLFLPYWAPLVFGVIDSVIVTIIVRAHAAEPLGLSLLSPRARLAYFIYLYVIMGAVSIICMVSAYSMAKAVSEADRSTELADAHAALERVHANLAVAYEQLSEMATTDATTGLLNHRALDEQLVLEVERAGRTGEPFAIVFADLDHFKRVNDTWGHHAGDHVLANLAARLRANLRAVDVVARYGGEEFVMVLPGQDHLPAVQSAERLRQIVAAAPMRLPDGQELAITISMGVAIFPDDGINVDAVMVAADIAMYRAKHAGRNRVCSTLDALSSEIDTSDAA